MVQMRQGFAKYFLASLAILGKRESCNFHHASESIGEVAFTLTEDSEEPPVPPQSPEAVFIPLVTASWRLTNE